MNAARADPDGSAVRLALGRKVTVNTMAAGEKLFVDLLPEGWSGLPPGLPQEVVEELARRAREAEKKVRAQQQAARQRVLPPVRVRVGVQPTFTRYTFGLPALIAVSVERNDDKMTMTFEAPLRFDLADVQAALPPMISAVECAGAQRCRLGAVRIHRQGRRPHVPRGQQLYRGCPGDPSRMPKAKRTLPRSWPRSRPAWQRSDRRLCRLSRRKCLRRPEPRRLQN